MNDDTAAAWLAGLGFHTDLQTPSVVWGRTFMPLTYACATGRINMLGYLSARGAATTDDMSQTFEDGNSCWHYACMSSYAVQVLVWLRDNGAVVLNNGGRLVFPVNDEGELPLHWAARYGYRDACEWLLAHGVTGDVSRGSDAGFFPLMEACCEGHLDVVRFLLRNGAGPDLRRETRFGGLTPLTTAARDGHLQVILYLVSKGACFKELQHSSYGSAGAVSEDENGDVDDTTDDDIYSHVSEPSKDIKRKDAQVYKRRNGGDVNEGHVENEQEILRRQRARQNYRRTLRRSRHIDESLVRQISKLTRPKLLHFSEKVEEEAELFRSLILKGTISPRASPLLSKLKGHGDALKMRIAAFLGVERGRKRRIAREFREALHRTISFEQRGIEEAAVKGLREVWPSKAKNLPLAETGESLDDVD